MKRVPVAPEEKDAPDAQMREIDGWKTSFAADARLPVEAGLDHRLSVGDLRVLMALTSWRSRYTREAKPSRANIARRCGMTENGVWRAVVRLESYGWLIRIKGKGGRPRLDGSPTHGQTATYVLRTPPTVRRRFVGLSGEPLEKTIAEVRQLWSQKTSAKRCQNQCH